MFFGVTLCEGWKWFFYFLLWMPNCKSQTLLGGLFDTDDLQLEAAFLVGADAWLGGRGRSIRLPPGDALAAEIATCDLLAEGIIGVVSGRWRSSVAHAASVCETAEVPLLTTDAGDAGGRRASLVDLAPHPPTVSQALVSLVLEKGWTSFTIIYEQSVGLTRVSDLLKLHTEDYKITLRQLVSDDGANNFRPILQKIKESGHLNYVVECSNELLSEVLIQAQQVGIMSDLHSYIVTNPDLHTINLEPFQYGGADITGLRYLDPGSQEVTSFVSLLNIKLHDLNPDLGEDDLVTPDSLTLDVALMYDAVLVYSTGLQELNSTDNVDIQPKNLDCNSLESWIHGTTIINYMMVNQIHGLTRAIEFDSEGFRSVFSMDVFELTSSGVNKVGTWNLSDGLNLQRKAAVANQAGESNSLTNETLLVLTALSPPYGMLKDSSVKLDGNDRYEGFGIELIMELGQLLKFNYTFELQEDGVYGSLNKQTNQWNGMVKKLLEDQADLAITDLTITMDRESAVDFTSPFMNLGISILFKKPTKLPPKLFSFISPFSQEVWLYLGLASFGVACLLFILGRVCPSEWQNPYPCIEEPEVLENQFSMANAMWFVLGSVLTQGSEIAPIAISTRIMASTWWFFSLIMVSSYTANLAAFLTVEIKNSLINSAEDLAERNDIPYGAKRDGSTLGFFKDAENPIYQKMYAYMSTHPEALTGSNVEGLERVQKETYAFLMESTSIEYIVERQCDVTQVGGLLDNKGYGIAMKKNSPFRNQLSQGVLNLQESGKIQSMKDKWWKEKRGGGACGGEESQGSSALALSLENVGGVFIVLVAGSVGALFAAVVEMLIDVFIISRKEKVPYSQELVDEIQFIMQCSGDTKPVRHRASPSGDSGGSSGKKSRRRFSLVSRQSYASRHSHASCHAAAARETRNHERAESDSPKPSRRANNHRYDDSSID